MSVPNPKGEVPLYLFTYNCNKKPISMDRFVPKLTQSFPEELASLYVFGVEEMCSIIDGSFEDSSSRVLISLGDVFLEALSEKYGNNDIAFHVVGMEHVGAIGIIMISPYPSQFFRVRSARAGTGYMYSSMKGAVGLRVTYSPRGRQHQQVSVGSSSLGQNQQTEFTFVNAHLAAFEGEYYFQKRNAEVLELMRSLNFNDGYGFLKPNAHSFFMGDLNYRTTKKLVDNSESLLELVSLQDQTESGWSKRSEEAMERLVLKYDELTKARADGLVFTGFSEHCIGFAPTYKYLLNTAIYNTKRSPSWCDRILYQSTYSLETETFPLSRKDRNILETEEYEQAEQRKKSLPLVESYNSIQTVLSDHQPVYLNITVPMKAPESILSSTGYLQILPSSRPNTHLRHSNEDDPTEELLAITDEVVSGPTQIYMCPTKLDNFIQMYVRVSADYIIGNGLWLTTTPSGRLSILALILISWGLWWVV
ncbi:hypothetical protein CLIB1423_03S01640 [[Candida] railenensis]|uniref:Inositol polyphosphate-related phosphatase domain-containing protein n=1 Tax=[Candida] railenensis TaxID=45579 RepID=A0A9P0VWQ8_9ASCO|nr:hypothetical protein CLIB1423_03S01640 [[Candida] railenensis]